MTKKVCLLTILLLVALAAGCAHNQADQASATATASPITTQAPDNSEITTAVDASGTKTETRTFRNNPRISKVVVTTRDGRRTVKAYSPRGEEREVTTTENMLEATGERVANAAGFVADKAEDVTGEAKKAGAEVADKAEDAAGKAKKVGAEVADKAEDVGDKAKKVGEKTVDVSKKAGEKTVEGAKKVGETTKKAVKKVIP